MNKKNIKLLICIVTMLALAGCSRNFSNKTPDAESEISSTPSSQSEAVTAPIHPPIIVETPPIEEPNTPTVVEPLPLTVDSELLGTITNDAIPWGPGVQQDDKGRSTAAVALQEKYKEYNTCFISDDENVVTLSFDQGYENGFTATILDVLKEKDAQAIFFITGHYLETSPELIQRMIDEGHIIGSHSDKHLNIANASIEDSVADLTALHLAVREQFDYEMQLFRFPEGAFTERSLALVDQMGYKSVFWSFAYRDWIPTDQMSEEDAMEKVTDFLHPGEMALLHTVGETNSLILDDLIDYARAEGYEISPPSDIFEATN